MEISAHLQGNGLSKAAAGHFLAYGKKGLYILPHRFSRNLFQPEFLRQKLFVFDNHDFGAAAR